MGTAGPMSPLGHQAGGLAARREGAAETAALRPTAFDNNRPERRRLGGIFVRAGRRDGGAPGVNIRAGRYETATEPSAKRDRQLPSITTSVEAELAI